MNSSVLKAALSKTGIAAALLLAGGVAMAQSTVALTAAPTATTLPDGQTVPMWGYRCGAVSLGVTCTAPNGTPQTVQTPTGGWQPPLITVPSGASLTITLTNSLSFTTTGAPNLIPTSLVISGLLGGGLGAAPTRMTTFPQHPPQGTTWPGQQGGTGVGDTVFTPPTQAARVRSFATEVAAGTTSGPLVWTVANLRPGTYLIHSGTQPSIQHSMGLYGVLRVTDPANVYPYAALPSGTAAFDTDLTLLLSEIDPLQNRAVDKAVRTAGFNDAQAWNGQTGKCGDPLVTQCYPPVVNYDPRYYLINGVSFDRNNSAASALAVPALATQGRVLLRFANAGLRMHVPSVVGAEMTLLAEDSNKLPGVAKKQNSLFLAAGKTSDVTIAPAAAAGAYTAATHAVYDRALSLSTNNQRDGGMQVYLDVNGGGAAPAPTTALAVADSYFKVAGNILEVSDPARGVIANDVGIYGVALSGAPPAGLTLNPNGTFTYTGVLPSTSFTYCGNGATSGPACATVTLAACTGACLGGTPTAVLDTYTSPISTRMQVSPPGVLGNDSDPSGLPLKTTGLTAVSGGTVTLNPDGSFIATPTTPPTGLGTATVTFQYRAINSHNTPSGLVTASVLFRAGNGLSVAVKDAKTGTAITDYRWMIEEDRSVFIDPKCQVNSTPRPLDSNGEACPALPVTSLATNFHIGYMPVVAQGCVGTVSCELGQTRLNTAGASMPVVCDIGHGDCRESDVQRVAVNPSQVYLDRGPVGNRKRYYISILPGDGANPVTEDPQYIATGFAPDEGHTMGGAQISPAQLTAAAAGTLTAVNVILQKTPLEPAKISVFVFQDDNPLNGQEDAGGGVDVIAPNEAGLGGFNLLVLDKAGMFGDSAGQITYDMFGMPVTNALAGTIDPATGLDACPISRTSGDGLVGVIVTCPRFEAVRDGGPVTTTLSPLAGHAIIANMYAGFYEVVAAPGADRIARGEEWLQTNTLDGTKGIEAFIKPGEPGYFQEFGPGGFHITFGMANPKIINNRKAAVCAAQPCTATVRGNVTALRMSRTPDQRVYSSGSYDAYGFTQCYVSLGGLDSADFAFAKCDDQGRFEFTGMPVGDWRITVFDQYNDLLVDGMSTPVRVRTGANTQGSVCTGPATALICNVELPITQWRTNVAGRVFLDQNGDGVSQPEEPGLPLVPYNIRYRDGSYAAFNNTDLAGYAGFNEVFPFINWLVVDIDNVRHKLTGIHVVYDAGGPVDGSLPGGVPCAGVTCGSSTIGAGILNSRESPTAHLPAALRFPGSRYCANADCTGMGVFNPVGANSSDFTPTQPGSTGRVDPGWVGSQGWQGLLGQYSVIEFAMKPFRPATATTPAENGGIKGHVLYTPTRPFDDPALLVQLGWAPGVPNATVNLYQQVISNDGVTKTLRLVDTTKSASWDDFAQGFRSGNVPNMNCPGQETSSPFYFTLENSRQWLNPGTAMAESSRFKCFDGWPMHNQVQPAPYNGLYKFPSIIGRDANGVPTGAGSVNGTPGPQPGSNCTICVPNPDDGTPMLPAGTYVVEVVVPQGYELVKEEDKNILLGDAYIAPAVQQVPGGIGNIFIMPDQAAVNAFYNPRNPIQPLTNNGAFARAEGDTGSVEVFWPCVGAKRVIPDFNSLFPFAGQAAPFAGATRAMCDRKEVKLNPEASVLVKFYIFSSTHVGSKFTGLITNDLASEFDPFSPQFGEKLGMANLPVAFKDFAGNEISRVYSDQWGKFNGVTFSSYTVNPPSPSGYIPQMMITCMNDPGPILDTRVGSPTLGQMIKDPLFNPAYSNFCYEIPFMPGQTAHLDTPVLPTMGFAGGYNLPDCEYPDTTPAIARVVSSDFLGPWVNGTGTETLTITSLGDKQVLNHAYSGPSASTAPFNQKFVTRHYGFGPRPAGCGTSGACPNATIGGVPMTAVTTWTDTTIVGTVPPIGAALSAAGVGSTCGPTANQTPYQITSPASVGTSARCGQLVITAANGKKSIDTITVTRAGKPPTLVTPTSPSSTLFGQTFANPLQTAINSAAAGDLIIVAPGTYKELLLMWKPVRLQGVGAASVTLDADAHPAGRLDPWRKQVVCLFGLTLEGQPAAGPYDGCPESMFRKVDRLPLEHIIGWDATANGNLAQQIQEPTLMGAYEGAGITVLGKGANIPFNPGNPGTYFGVGAEGGFPAGTLYLTSTAADCSANVSNFLCNPARIDGMSVTNASQGGGAIYLHAWNHNTEVSNNRVFANHGTLTGGISVGTGEIPPAYIVGGDAPIWFPIPPLTPDGTQLPYGFNKSVRLHHNSVTSNASLGDALYSGTPSAGGGVTFCSGADNYRFNNNWVCGNLSSGDGGGVVHAGFSANGNISYNQILFNQTASATIPTHGGGLAILGAATDRILANGLECGSVDDADCPPGTSEGVGPGLVVDGNLIMGNSAESGTGGGIRLQRVNGDEVVAFPNLPALWYEVTITNNIIANNVAGWDGAGVSMQDALKVMFINNTVVSNDSTASAGVLFNTIGAGLSSVPPPGCNPSAPTCSYPRVTTSTNQTAGLVTMAHTPNLAAQMTTASCPLPLAGLGYDYVGTNCRAVSLPRIANNIFWQNRAFHVGVGPLGGGQQNQQSVVTLYPALNQTLTGMCATVGLGDPAGTGINASATPVYWDLGVRGDTAQTPVPNVPGGFRLFPTNSILTSTTGYGTTGSTANSPSNPLLLSQYCNGSRLAPEGGGLFAGFNAPPGRAESTGLYPIFALDQITVAATVDEGNNFVNLSYGPLASANAAAAPGTGVAQSALGNYSISFGPLSGPLSPARNGVPLISAGTVLAPDHDFFNNPRKTFATGPVDIGAVEIGTGASATITGGPLVFGNVVVGTTSASLPLVLTNTGSVNLTIPAAIFSPSPQFSLGTIPPSPCILSATLVPGASCNITVDFTPSAAGPLPGTLTAAGPVIFGLPVTLTGTGVTGTTGTVAFTPGTNGAATLTGTTLAFGNNDTGSVSSTVTLTISTGPVTFGNATLTNGSPAAFSKGADGCSGNSFVAGNTCTITVNFNAPSGSAARTGTLTVPHSGAGVNPRILSLTGS